MYRMRFVWVIGTTSFNVNVFDPSALVSNDTFFGTNTGSASSGGYVSLGPTGLYSVGLYLFGTKASPALGAPTITTSSCTLYSMDDFVWPPSQNFGMSYLVTTTSDSATIKCTVTPVSSQSIEGILVVTRLQ